MKKLLLLLLVSASLLSYCEIVRASPADLLGPNGWFLSTPHPGDATLTQTTPTDGSGPAETITVTTPADPFYMIQMIRDIQGVIPAGHHLQIQFSARSATLNPIRVSIEKTAAPYTAVTAKLITLTPDWKDYTIDGTSVDFVPAGINVHFQVGQQIGSIQLKDITVRDLGMDPGIAVAELALKPDQIQARIEKYRKGTLTVTVLDAAGRPVKNVLVTITQTRHAFLFGCNAFGYNPNDTSDAQKAYQDRFAALFNYATLPFYWGAFESQQGNPDYARLRAMADWCHQHGITPKGHPLVWQQVWPSWAPTDPDAAIPVLHARVHDLVTHYKNFIHYWDVVNEANSSADYTPANGESLWVKRDGPASVVETALGWARAAGQGNQETFLYNDFDTTQDNIDLLTQIKKDGKLPDAIGIQSHMHQGTWPLTKIWEVCQDFAQFGRPIHFTETTILSGPVQTTNGTQVFLPTTPDGEAAQADYVTKFYTILFSHPSVRAITWWDFSDKNSWMNAPAGFLRADMSPKPVYTELMDLIHKTWWTDATVRSDDHGRATKRVFYGAYTVTATDSQGHSVHQNVFFPESSLVMNVTVRLERK